MSIHDQAARVRDYAQRGMNDDRVSVSVRAFMRDTFEIAEHVLRKFEEEGDGGLTGLGLDSLPPYPAKPNQPRCSPECGERLVKDDTPPRAFLVSHDSHVLTFTPCHAAGLRLLGTLCRPGTGKQIAEAAISRGEALRPEDWDRAYTTIAGGLPALFGEDGQPIPPDSIGL